MNIKSMLADGENSLTATDQIIKFGTAWIQNI